MRTFWRALQKSTLFAFLALLILGCNKVPVADFTANPTSVLSGDTVRFTDNSEYDPTEWFWEFGDGLTSTDQDPGHIYNSTGLYSVKLTATNDAGSHEIEKIDLIEVLDNTVKDYDGNEYRIVRIGTQIWMAENLATTTLNDGTTIPNITDSIDWFGLSSAAYCWYENDAASNKALGALYNWYAVESDKVCPEGWHVPSDDEWMELEVFIGMNSTAAQNTGNRGSNVGEKLKATGGWDNNVNGSDMYRFTGIPSGVRTQLYSPQFTWKDSALIVWTETPFNEDGAYFRGMVSQNNSIQRHATPNNEGLSIRCIKDNN